MEVVVPMAPATAAEFNFDSTCSSPYMSAPSSPKRFGDYYFSAPTSPSRASAIYEEFRALSKGRTASSAAIPFDWEEKPGTPKGGSGERAGEEAEEGDDFAFDFSGQLDPSYITAAEELFEQGKIRPLKPPSRMMQAEELPSPKSPKSPRRMFREAFSPRQKKGGDPFAAAAAAEAEPRKGGGGERERGRERAGPSSQGSSTRRAARSLSPYRVSDFAFEEPHQAGKAAAKPPAPPSAAPKSGSKKWSIKDFLLFRSASEGRASGGKDPLRKYSLLAHAKTKAAADDVKNSSFRSTDSSGSMRKGRASAHELHYTANRAVSEEMRRKTFLPYRQGLLGCLGFSPTAHGLAKGFQSITRR
ncbi:hypothetical protein H6P81_010826 [Aristolochia fimbriata]|uniref:Uncharacterized protein n=1 Tax=Aristolochia fimbriata TaxID=158543 RepID=A0AAV7ER01_ARIFI|nr:hypothetical protein H6P81_010826 [Aristolochia fimbriata]